MNKLYLNSEITSLPIAIKTTFWQFIRNDMEIRSFELWVYSNNELSQIMRDDSYQELLLMDYKDKREITALKKSIYALLIQFPEPCLCSSFPNYTLFCPFTSAKGIALKNPINLFKNVINIEKFRGEPPIHQSRWYNSGNLCFCTKCKTWWFVISEWCEGADYYLIRLSEADASLITQFPSWPNEQWPENLRDWNAFLSINFRSWNNLYIEKKHVHSESTLNFFENYDLNV